VTKVINRFKQSLIREKTISSLYPEATLADFSIAPQGYSTMIMQFEGAPAMNIQRTGHFPDFYFHGMKQQFKVVEGISTNPSLWV
jgi:hypothetical protein